MPKKAEKEAKEKIEKEENSEETTSKETPAAPAPTPPATPVKESRLQTSLQEYLTYKQLIKKVKR